MVPLTPKESKYITALLGTAHNNTPVKLLSAKQGKGIVQGFFMGERDVYRFRITPGRVRYRIANQEWALRPKPRLRARQDAVPRLYRPGAIRAIKKKQCQRGIPCNNSCVKREYECDVQNGMVRGAALQYFKQGRRSQGIGRGGKDINPEVYRHNPRLNLGLNQLERKLGSKGGPAVTFAAIGRNGLVRDTGDFRGGSIPYQFKSQPGGALFAQHDPASDLGGNQTREGIFERMAEHMGMTGVNRARLVYGDRSYDITLPPSSVRDDLHLAFEAAYRSNKERAHGNQSRQPRELSPAWLDEREARNEQAFVRAVEDLGGIIKVRQRKG